MSTKRKFTEEELVALIKDKNTDAFSALYENYSSALYGVILKVVDVEEHAQDILQDSFVKIWKNFASYDAGKGKLFTWMLNIARNSAIDALRSKQDKMSTKIQSLDKSVSELNAQAKVSTGVDHIGLNEVIKKLRPDYVQLIDLICFKGYAESDISKELNILPVTVKTRTRTALNQMRDILKAK